MEATARIEHRTFFRLSSVVLLCSLVLFIYTGYFYVLSIPFVWLYSILMLTDWRKAYMILLFSLPLSVRISFFDDSLSLCVPDEPMMWLFFLLSLLLLAHRSKELPIWWRLNTLTIIVLAQLTWLILAVIFSTVPFYSAKFLLSKMWMLAAFFLLPVWILRTKEDIQAVFVVILVPLFLGMLYVMTMHGVGGFSFSNINIAIGKLYENHVEYSTFISMFFPLVFVACLWLKGRNKKLYRLMYAIAMFFVATIFLSYARAAVLALVFSFFIYWAIKKRLAHLVMPGIYVVIALGLFYVVKTEKYLDLRPNYEQTHMYWDFSEHMEATFQGRDESSMERLYRWIAAMRMSTEKPLTGFGPHGFYYNYKMYALNSFKTFASKNKEHSTTHNYFLYLLVEQGYPAMILYALLNIVIFSKAQRIYHRFRDRFYKLCTIGIAMLFAASFVNNFFSELIDTHKVGGLFFISLTFLVLLDRKSREGQGALVVDP